MRLICPGCGLTASAEAWLNDAEARKAMLALIKLPPALHDATLTYLGLFRPDQRALSWARVLRLLAEIAALTGAGHVQVDKKVARPCPPGIWAAAMEQMAQRRERLERPLKNNNYLRQVAYSLADQADAGREASRCAAEQQGHRPPADETPEDADGLLPIERQMLDKGLPVPTLRNPAGAELDLKKMFKGVRG